MNFSLDTIFWKSSSTSQALVTLHLPFPVIKSFFPSFSFFSNTWTSLPFFAANMDANIPAAPPPTISTLLI